MNLTVKNFESHKFAWLDYTSFFLTLSITCCVGIYFSLKNKTNDTVAGYMLGNKNMSIFPVITSLIVSQISGLTLIGKATEMYMNGAQYSLCSISFILYCLIAIHIFNPLFYKLQLISFHKYFELRFSRTVRLISSMIFTSHQILFLPMVVYSAALAVSQVTGFHRTAISVFLCLFCTTYTALGGFKAVVWTDAFQGGIIIISVFTFLICGAIETGDVTSIWSKAKAEGRLEFFNMDPDPRLRISFWSSAVGASFYHFSSSVISPVFVQRCLSLGKENQTKWATMAFCLGVMLLVWSSTVFGLIAYARYKGCDPLTLGVIEKPDQILPYFVFDIAEKIHSFPGIFIAGNVSGALSTMSSSLNTVAGNIFEDLIKPRFKAYSAEARATKTIKIIVVLLGLVIVVGVIIMERAVMLIDVAIAFGGVACGVSSGLLIIGALIPVTNTKGAIFGSLAGIFMAFWLIIGYSAASFQGLINRPHLPLSVDECPGNFTITAKKRNALPEAAWSMIPYIFPLSQITIYYYCLICSLTVIVVGVTVSYISGSKEGNIVNPDLFVPFVRRRYYKKSLKKIYTPVKQETQINTSL